MDNTSPSKPIDIYVDAHVHFYSCFDEQSFYDSADTNIRRAARDEDDTPTVGCLCLTECAADNYFSDLSSRMTIDADDWSVRATGEPTSLIAYRGDDPRLVLIAGRQVITQEGLEVLAIGTSETFTDGMPLDRTVDLALNASACVVLPWAFGKWWFGRGKTLRSFIDAPGTRTIFVGDNAGRPAPSPASPVFSAAAQRGFWLLPGSDPLPLGPQVHQTGCYGFIWRTDALPERPATDLKAHLLGLKKPPMLYGTRNSWASFIQTQLALRLASRS